MKRIQKLVQIALKQGRSPRAIISRIEQAVAGVYEARGYADVDYDLHRLIRNLAGRKGLYALSKAIGGPSSSTIQRRTNPATVLPSAGKPTPSEISSNIRSCLGEALSAATGRVRTGWSLMVDGLAIRQRLRRLKRDGLNWIVGPCREHVDGLCF